MEKRNNSRREFNQEKMVKRKELDEISKRTEESFTENGQEPQPDAHFYDVATDIYGTQNNMLMKLNIDPATFARMVIYMVELDLDTSSRFSFFGSPESRALLLLLYIQTETTNIIRTLSAKHIKTKETILRQIYTTITAFHKVIVPRLLIYKNYLSNLISDNSEQTKTVSKSTRKQREYIFDVFNCCFFSRSPFSRSLF